MNRNSIVERLKDHMDLIKEIEPDELPGWRKDLADKLKELEQWANNRQTVTAEIKDF